MSKKQNQSIIRKMISITIVALILGAVCFLGGVLLAQRSHSGKTTVTSDTLFQQLRSVSQLTTVEYHYTNMGKFEKNADLNGWTIPLKTKTSGLPADGFISKTASPPRSFSLPGAAGIWKF